MVFAALVACVALDVADFDDEPMTPVEAMIQDGLADEAEAALGTVVGPFELEDRVHREDLFGFIALLRDDAAAANDHFTTVLLLQPQHRWHDTALPEVRRAFGLARKTAAKLPPLKVRLQAPAVLAYNAPVSVVVTTTGNPNKLLQTVQVCVSLQTQPLLPLACTKVPASSTATTVTLPALAAPKDGGAGTAEISISGLDRGGDEVLRLPSLRRSIRAAPAAAQP